MTSIRRLAGVATAVVLASSAPLSAHAAPTQVGRLAFVTSAGDLDLVAVMSDGTVAAAPEQIAPVTDVSAPKYVKVSDLVVSADQQRLAWLEGIFKPSKKYGDLEVGGRVVVRNNVTGVTTSVHSNEVPLGFSGHRLVVEGGYTKRLVMTPSPHFVKLPGDAYAVATYAKGVVDVASSQSPKAKVDRERLRLTTFSGHHTLLHQYDVGLDYRAVAANLDAVSPDQKHLLVERGNHQDFDGLGPSSLFDEFTLSGHRRQLGHYGSAKAKWRLHTAAFVGKTDQVWLALHDDGKTVHGVVVRYVGGKWRLVESKAITVAGSPLGYAAVQPGKWVLDTQAPDGAYNPVATSDVELWFGGSKLATVPVQGSELVWTD